MNIMERNIRRAAEEVGLRNEYIQEGIEKGIEKGIETERLLLARKALSKGYPIEEIMDLTGLSREDILTLNKNSVN